MTQTQHDQIKLSMLKPLVDQVHSEAIEYAGRAGDVCNLEGWIAKGDYRQAEFKAGQIIERQRQLRDAEQNGLPVKLQHLVDQVHAEAIDFAGRAGDVRSLEEWIAKGDHRQADFKARQIVERQRQLRDVQQKGLPAHLQQLVGQVHAGAIEYVGRAGDVRSLEDWIDKGDHRQAEFKAGQIVERQRQFRDAQQNGLPAQLQHLVDQVHAEAIEYAGRAGDVRSLEEWIAKGDHRQADFKARQIVERQRQFHDALQHGLPGHLQQLVDQVCAEVTEYAGRAGDVSGLDEWIATGDHRQAEFKARQIIERQQNSRTGL